MFYVTMPFILTLETWIHSFLPNISFKNPFDKRMPYVSSRSTMESRTWVPIQHGSLYILQIDIYSAWEKELKYQTKMSTFHCHYKKAWIWITCKLVIRIYWQITMFSSECFLIHLTEASRMGLRSCYPAHGVYLSPLTKKYSEKNWNCDNTFLVLWIYRTRVPKR